MWEYTIEEITAIIGVVLIKRLGKLECDFDKGKLLADIRADVVERREKNPSAFNGHDIDSEAYVEKSILERYVGRSSGSTFIKNGCPECGADIYDGTGTGWESCTKCTWMA